jgi:hypothetical protein
MANQLTHSGKHTDELTLAGRFHGSIVRLKVALPTNLFDG